MRPRSSAPSRIEGWRCGALLSICPFPAVARSSPCELPRNGVCDVPRSSRSELPRNACGVPVVRGRLHNSLTVC